MAKNKAFTLAEILVALGILAIGMSMVASVFMAAMQFNMRSRNSVLGRIICENAMVVAADDVRRSPAIGSMMRRMLLRKAPVVEGDEV